LIGDVRHSGDVTVVDLEGRLDAVSAPETRAELHELVERGYRKLVLNLREIGFIDSAGLGSLVSCLRRCAAEGGDLRLAEVPAFCRSIFQLTRLTRVFDVTQTEGEAVASFADSEGTE
jgi:anti-sigma B factor antagonist